MLLHHHTAATGTSANMYHLPAALSALPVCLHLLGTSLFSPISTPSFLPSTHYTHHLPLPSSPSPAHLPHLPAATPPAHTAPPPHLLPPRQHVVGMGGSSTALPISALIPSCLTSVPSAAHTTNLYCYIKCLGHYLPGSSSTPLLAASTPHKHKLRHCIWYHSYGWHACKPASALPPSSLSLPPSLSLLGH